MRSFLIFTHKYVGLILGLALGITGLSGSIIVFDRELDEFLDPATADFSPGEAVGDLDLALINAAAAVNNGSAPTRIALGRDASAPHIIRFPTPEGASGPVEVAVNPNTSEVTAVRIWGEYPVTWIYRFHYSYLAGETGELVVGVLGLLLIFFCISGTVIWWPKFGFRSSRQIKRAFSVRFKAGPLLLNYDLHRLFGILSVPVLLVVAFTGVELVWHEPVEKIVSSILTVEHEPEPVSIVADNRILVSGARKIALGIFSDSRVSRIYLPRTEDGAYEVTLIRQGDWWREYAATKVWIDQYSGEVRGYWDSKNLKSGNAFLQWMFPLHNGDGLGIVGRMLVFVSGLLPMFFFCSGFYIWCRKRRSELGTERI